MPEISRVTAKAPITTPIAVAPTPKEDANIGIAGITKPKPMATKKPTVVSAATTGGKSRKGDLSLIKV